MSECELYFLTNDLVSLAEDVSSLWVSKDSPVNTSIIKHLSGEFSSVCSIFILWNVLCCHLNSILNCVLGCEEVEGWGGDYDFNLVGIEFGLVKGLTLRSPLANLIVPFCFQFPPTSNFLIMLMLMMMK